MNYYNTGYQWANPYGYPNTQPSGYPTNAVQNNQQNQNELITVLITDSKAVDNYPVANGTSVLLMNYSEKKFWIKSMTNGVTPEITEHSFEVVSGNNDISKSQITRKEFDELAQNVEEMKKFIEDLK